MPKDGDTHQCELLEYLGRYLDYVGPSSQGYSRWRFVVPEESLGDGKGDTIFLQYVLYCPCCGMDLREDTGPGFAGKPRLHELIQEAKNES